MAELDFEPTSSCTLTSTLYLGLSCSYLAFAVTKDFYVGETHLVIPFFL